MDLCFLFILLGNLLFFVNEFLIWVISYFFVNGFLIWLLLSPNQNGTLSALGGSSLNWKMDLSYVFGIWVLRKLLAFSLKSCLLSFFPVVWLLRK